jgi:hypothetical protein
MESGSAARDARVLLPWMGEAQARQALGGGRGTAEVTAEQEKALAAAREELRRRPAGVNQDGLIQPLPGSLLGYAARLREDPDAAGRLAEGYVPALVDLTRLCVFQPAVHTGGAAQRAAGAQPGDLASIAALTLPMTEPVRVIPQFDQDRMTFTASQATQNLQIIGAFGGPAAEADELPPGTVSVGFHLRVTTSFVEVAGFQNRFFLRDGYHRCLGLLRRGVAHAPALVRAELPLAELVPGGMLPFEAITGDRPPVLPDYWDDRVSRAARLPASRKVIIVRGSELSVTESPEQLVFRRPDSAAR